MSSSKLYRPVERAATVVASTVLALVLVACGGGGGDSGATPPPVGNVGPAGATVASDDGKATLVIPAGALGATLQISIRPATTADGYVDDPQIVPGTVYKLDTPTETLTAAAMLDIAVPPTAAATSTGRKSAESVVPSKGFLGCFTEVPGGYFVSVSTDTAGSTVSPSPFLVCVFDQLAYSPSPQVALCPTGFIVQNVVPLWYAPDYFTYENPHTIPDPITFGLSTESGRAVVCTIRPDPIPAVATLVGGVVPLPDKPALIHVLNPNVFAILLDKTPPVVQFTSNTTVIPTGNGMAKVHLEATATDNLLLKRVELSEETVHPGNPILGQPFVILKSALGSFPAAPTYVWESAPMPVDQIYSGQHYFYAKAFDAAGNQATASQTFDAATPLITSFTATPSTAAFGGQPVTLAWTTPGLGSPNYSDTLVLTSSAGGAPVDVTGLASTVVTVTATTTFTLTGTNPSGPGSATVTVQIGPQGAPTIGSFTATPTAVPWNAPTTLLQWTSTGADTLTLAAGAGPAVDVTGLTSKTVPITADTTFTLTAANTNPTHATATVHVTFIPKPVPTITSFTASPATLPSNGGPVTLNWAAPLADSFSIASTAGPTIGPLTGTSYTTPSPVTATTTYTLTASDASGPGTPAALTVVVASSGDRFVDVNAGSDGNACSQAAPCKTIAKGLAGAQSGSTVWLVSGLYDVATQSPNAETIPDGVTLKAVSAGGAVVTNGPLVAAGSAKVNGIVLDRDVSNVNAGSITATSTTGTPTLLITGVRTTQEASFVIGGNVKATMTPGALVGGLYTSNLSAGQDAVISLSGSGELLVQGGIVDGNSAYTVYPLFLVAGNSKLTLDGATIQNRQANAIVAADSAQVFLKNSALLDNVSVGIVTSGTNTVSIENSQISHYMIGIMVSSTANVSTISIKNSSIVHSLQYAIRSDQGGADAVIVLDGVTLTDNYAGMLWNGLSTATSIDIKNSAVTGNTGAGIQLFGAGSLFKMRKTNVSNNGNNRGGVAIYTSGVGIDLGTQLSPGGNTLSNNFANNNGNNLYIGQVSGPITVQAVGNIWTPNQQGADAMGRYSTPPGYAPVVRTGPLNGVNFGIDANVTVNF